MILVVSIIVVLFSVEVGTSCVGLVLIVWCSRRGMISLIKLTVFVIVAVELISVVAFVIIVRCRWFRGTFTDVVVLLFSASVSRFWLAYSSSVVFVRKNGSAAVMRSTDWLVSEFTT